MDQSTPLTEPSAGNESTPRPFRPARRFLRPLIGLIIALAIFVSGFELGNRYTVSFADHLRPVITPVDTSAALNDPLFGEVQALLKQDFLHRSQLNDQSMLYGAISGMVASAGDPYTSFFDPSENQNVQDQLSGTYEGIGAELGYKDNQLVVIAPLKDSPAKAAGLLSGDALLQIDSKTTTGMSLDQAVDLIRGKAGTTVKLVVVHQGQSTTQTISITRKQITVDSIDLSFKDNPNAPAGNQQIAYLKLSRFGDTTIQEWDKAVAQITANHAKALVLDLRDNPGGYFDAAIHVGSEFFDGGTIVGQQDAQGHVQNFSVDHAGQLTTIPVIVLINQGSASAAEIVSGALHSRHRATLVGVNSFGKGSVQQVIDLPDKTSLHVTIAKWLMPDGKNIDKVGIAPDQEVKITQDDINAGQDPQLDAAIQDAAQKIQ